jgi:hypothetical protein
VHLGSATAAEAVHDIHDLAFTPAERGVRGDGGTVWCRHEISDKKFSHENVGAGTSAVKTGRMIRSLERLCSSLRNGAIS